MIEIDPQAEYNAAQVAALLNMPETPTQGLWQQWPVCGYDVLGYCHRQAIPFSIRPLAPESKFQRAYRLARARSENRTEQELFPMRDYYHSMVPQERQRFADLIHSLAAAADTFSVSSIYVQVQYRVEQHDEQGNCVYSESAEASPRAIRKAIPLWEETPAIQQ
jgi:hypothetical protein